MVAAKCYAKMTRFSKNYYRFLKNVCETVGSTTHGEENNKSWGDDFSDTLAIYRNASYIDNK